MLEGLQRLRANNYRFTLSDRAKENMTEAVQDGNHIIEFLALDGYICFKADSEVSSKDLYTDYKLWCEDNTVNALSAKSFGSFLKQNEAAYNLNIPTKFISVMESMPGLSGDCAAPTDISVEIIG